MSSDRDRPLAQLAQSSGGVQALDERDFTFAEDLGKYRLLGALGSGGMADVFLAVADGPEGFRKLCVLKLLKDTMTQDEEFRAMFLDEARLAARLNHPHIVQTFEVGETHHRLMIAMEYIEGQPATRVCRRLTAEQFPLTTYVSILCDVLDALEYAHALTDYDGSILGIVHRDVSPHNIIIGYDGRAKLVDFGIAKSAAAMQQTQAGVVKGKAGYMAPEQAMMRVVDGRADVFSVGVVLWEAIAGRRLADGMTSNDILVRRIAGHDPRIIDIVPDVDPRLAAICDRAMAFNPDERFATAADFQLELEAWLQERGEPSRKALAKSMREAFRAERDQLRALVEHRMGEGVMSLARTSITQPPPAVAGASNPPTPPHTSMQSPSTISVAPEERRRGTPALLVAGIASIVLLGGGATLYLMTRSSPTHGPAAAGASSSADSTSGAARQLTPADSATATPVVPAATLPVTAPAAPNTRPAFVPAGRPPVGPFHPPVAAPPPPSAAPVSVAPVAPSSTGGSTIVQPSKPPTRPLDEKDPYAQ